MVVLQSIYTGILLYCSSVSTKPGETITSSPEPNLQSESFKLVIFAMNSVIDSKLCCRLAIFLGHCSGNLEIFMFLIAVNV